MTAPKAGEERWTLHWANTPSALVCHEGYCPHCFDVVVHKAKPDSIEVVPAAALDQANEALRLAQQDADDGRRHYDEWEALADGPGGWKDQIETLTRQRDEAIAGEELTTSAMNNLAGALTAAESKLARADGEAREAIQAMNEAQRAEGRAQVALARAEARLKEAVGLLKIQTETIKTFCIRENDTFDDRPNWDKLSIYEMRNQEASEAFLAAATKESTSSARTGQ